MGNFARVLHHLDMKDVKKRHLKELAAKKIKEEKIKKEAKAIQEIAEKQKSNWREDLKESDWTPVSGSIANSTSQKFTYSQPNFQTGEPNTFTASGLGGVESLPSSVRVDLGFGETMNVDAPNYNQLALAGYAKPILMRRQEAGDTNKKLDASQEFAQKVGADVMMNARVKTELSLEQKREAVKKYKNDLEEYDKKSEARAREIENRRKSNLSKVRSFVAKYGENLDDIKGVQTFIKIAEGGKKLIVINQDSIFRDSSDKFNVRVYEAEQGKVITRQTGNFGRVDSSIFDNPFTNRKSSGQATIMYDGVGGEVENKTFSIEEVPPIQTPEPPEHMKKNLSKGWQPVTKEDEGLINKLNTFFGTSVTGVKFAAKLAIQLARGDTTPITKSPGVGFDANATRVIHSAIETALKANATSYSDDTQSWYNPKTGEGQVMDGAYNNLDNPIDNITRAALGKFTFKVTPKGVQVIDTYDISKVTHIGSVSNPITDFITKIITAGHGRGTGFTDQFGQNYDAQQTANVITGIAMRRGAELGFDMVDTDGKTIQPIFSMEDAYADSQQLATPKGFNIPINYTMPTGITIKNLLNPRQYTQNRKSSKAVNRIKSMAKTRRQSLSLDEPIVRRKKKRG